MRVRTAKQRAQRIDLNYFKHPHGLKRWRILLSLAAPDRGAALRDGVRRRREPQAVQRGAGLERPRLHRDEVRGLPHGGRRDRRLPGAHHRHRLPDLPRRAHTCRQPDARAGLLDLPPGTPRPRPAREDGRRVLRRLPQRSEDHPRRPQGGEERQRVSVGPPGVRRGEGRRAGSRPAALQPRRAREGLDPRTQREREARMRELPQARSREDRRARPRGRRPPA